MRAFIFPLRFVLVMMGGLVLAKLLPGVVRANPPHSWHWPPAVKAQSDALSHEDPAADNADSVLMPIREEADLERWLFKLLGHRQADKSGPAASGVVWSDLASKYERALEDYDGSGWEHTAASPLAAEDSGQHWEDFLAKDITPAECRNGVPEEHTLSDGALHRPELDDPLAEDPWAFEVWEDLTAEEDEAFTWREGRQWGDAFLNPEPACDKPDPTFFENSLDAYPYPVIEEDPEEYELFWAETFGDAEEDADSGEGSNRGPVGEVADAFAGRPIGELALTSEPAGPYFAEDWSLEETGGITYEAGDPPPARPVFSEEVGWQWYDYRTCYAPDEDDSSEDWSAMESFPAEARSEYQCHGDTSPLLSEAFDAWCFYGYRLNELVGGDSVWCQRVAVDDPFSSPAQLEPRGESETSAVLEDPVLNHDSATSEEAAEIFGNQDTFRGWTSSPILDWDQSAEFMEENPAGLREQTSQETTQVTEVERWQSTPWEDWESHRQEYWHEGYSLPEELDASPHQSDSVPSEISLENRFTVGIDLNGPPAESPTDEHRPVGDDHVYTHDWEPMPEAAISPEIFEEAFRYSPKYFYHYGLDDVERGVSDLEAAEQSEFASDGKLNGEPPEGGRNDAPESRQTASPAPGESCGSGAYMVLPELETLENTYRYEYWEFRPAEVVGVESAASASEAAPNGHVVHSGLDSADAGEIPVEMIAPLGEGGLLEDDWYWESISGGGGGGSAQSEEIHRSSFDGPVFQDEGEIGWEWDYPDFGPQTFPPEGKPHNEEINGETPASAARSQMSESTESSLSLSSNLPPGVEGQIFWSESDWQILSLREHYGQNGGESWDSDRGLRSTPQEAHGDSPETPWGVDSGAQELAFSGGLLESSCPHEVLEASDIAILRQLAVLEASSPEARSSYVAEYLSTLGWDAYELVSHLERMAERAWITQIADPIVASVVLAVCRLVKRGELALSEGGKLLDRSLRSVPEDWARSVRALIEPTWPGGEFSDKLTPTVAPAETVSRPDLGSETGFPHVPGEE